MSQIQNTTQVFLTNDLVTATKLNNLIAQATITKEAITLQTGKTEPVAVDALLAYDASTDSLAKIEVGNLFVGVPVTTSEVKTNVLNSKLNSDIVVTPSAGTSVTGKTYNSADGLTVTVTSTEHGLPTGSQLSIIASTASYSGTYAITSTGLDTFTYQIDPVTSYAKTFTSNGVIVTVTSAGHGFVSGQTLVITANFPTYSGTYNITVTSGDTFTYNLATPAANSPFSSLLNGTLTYVKNGNVAGSGTCSYTKNAVVRTVGNSSIIGNQSVSGTVRTAGITATGQSTLNSVNIAGDVNAQGTVTFNGNVNFTGDLRYNGTSIWGLYAKDVLYYSDFNNKVFQWSDYVQPWSTRWGTWAANWWLTEKQPMTDVRYGTSIPAIVNDTHVIPEGEMWEVTYDYDLYLDCDDYYDWVWLQTLTPPNGIAGAETAIGPNGSAVYPIRHTRVPVGKTFVYTGPLTVTLKLRIMVQGGSGPDQIVVGWKSRNTRLINKYRRA